MTKKLFLLDAYALIYRAYFAFSNSPRINSQGLNTSAIFGFTNTLLEVIKKEQPEGWEQEINELETFFTGIALPTQPVKLNQFSTITNVSLFIESHLTTIRANTGKRSFLPYLSRLKNLKAVIKQ